MTLAVKEREELYLKSFRELEKTRAASAPEWIKALRAAGMEAFAELGFPTTRLEDWKYTNVAALTKVQYQPAQYEFNGTIAKLIQSLPAMELEGNRLVFMNGHYCKDLS